MRNLLVILMLISKVILLFHLDELSSITSFIGGSSQEICQ